MPVPAITLTHGQVLLQSASNTSTVSGVNSVDGKIQFGIVAAVYATCDKVVVGDSVMFDPKQGSQLFYGSTIYVLTDEENVSGGETPVP